jgi:hypothetical protein
VAYYLLTSYAAVSLGNTDLFGYTYKEAIALFATGSKMNRTTVIFGCIESAIAAAADCMYPAVYRLLRYTPPAQCTCGTTAISNAPQPKVNPRQVAVRFTVAATLGISFVKSEHPVFKAAIAAFPRDPKGKLGAAEKYNKMQKKAKGSRDVDGLEVGMVLTQVDDASLAHCPFAKVMTFVNQRKSSLLFPVYVNRGASVVETSGSESGAANGGASDNGEVSEFFGQTGAQARTAEQAAEEQTHSEQDRHLILVFAHPHMPSLLLPPQPPPTPPRVEIVIATAADSSSSDDDECDDAFFGDGCDVLMEGALEGACAVAVAMPCDPPMVLNSSYFGSSSSGGEWQGRIAGGGVDVEVRGGGGGAGQEVLGQEPRLQEGNTEAGIAGRRGNTEAGRRAVHRIGQGAAVAGGEGGVGVGEVERGGDPNAFVRQGETAQRWSGSGDDRSIDGGGAVGAATGVAAGTTFDAAILRAMSAGSSPQTDASAINQIDRPKRGWCGALQGDVNAQQQKLEDGCVIS